MRLPLKTVQNNSFPKPNCNPLWSTSYFVFIMSLKCFFTVWSGYIYISLNFVAIFLSLKICVKFPLMGPSIPSYIYLWPLRSFSNVSELTHMEKIAWKQLTGGSSDMSSTFLQTVWQHCCNPLLCLLAH